MPIRSQLLNVESKCLEFDLAAQGKTWVEAISELEQTNVTTY
jgi:hypothetical protein